MGSCSSSKRTPEQLAHHLPASASTAPTPAQLAPWLSGSTPADSSPSTSPSAPFTTPPACLWAAWTAAPPPRARAALRPEWWTAGPPCVPPTCSRSAQAPGAGWPPAQGVRENVCACVHVCVCACVCVGESVCAGVCVRVCVLMCVCCESVCASVCVGLLMRMVQLVMAAAGPPYAPPTRPQPPPAHNRSCCLRSVETWHSLCNFRWSGRHQLVPLRAQSKCTLPSATSLCVHEPASPSPVRLPQPSTPRPACYVEIMGILCPQNGPLISRRLLLHVTLPPFPPHLKPQPRRELSLRV